MQPALARHDAILRDAITAHDGSVVKMTGDGVHAAIAHASRGARVTGSTARAGGETWDGIGRLRLRRGPMP